MNNKIPTLNNILPESPDRIQKFSSEATSAVARMAHVNRAAAYFGMDVEYIEVDFATLGEIYINRPCGHIKILNANIAANSTITVKIVWESAAFLSGKNLITPYYAQFTGAGSNTDYVYSITEPLSAVDANLDVKIYSKSGTVDCGFFFSIVPQKTTL